MWNNDGLVQILLILLLLSLSGGDLCGEITWKVLSRFISSLDMLIHVTKWRSGSTFTLMLLSFLSSSHFCWKNRGTDSCRSNIFKSLDMLFFDKSKALKYCFCCNQMAAIFRYEKKRFFFNKFGSNLVPW